MLNIFKILCLLILSIWMISSCTRDKSDLQPQPQGGGGNDTLIVCDSIEVCDSIIIVCDSVAPYTCDTTFISCNTVNVCDTVTACDTANITYAVDIEPIISTNCATSGCHVSGGSGPGNFTTYSGLKAKVDMGVNGTVEHRVVVLKDMPLGGSLTQDEIFKIDCWIQDGAPNN